MEKEILKIKPRLIESNIQYIREESSGYLTLVPNERIELKDYTFNPTVRYILSQCDGNNSIKKIIKNLSKKFQDIGIDVITNDVINTIRLFEHYDNIDIGGSSMYKNQVFKIKKGLELEHLNESDFSRIIDYIHQNKGKNIFHEDIYAKVTENEEEVVLRYHLFSYLSSFYFLKDNGEIKGLISVIYQPFVDFSYSTINYMICDEHYGEIFLTSFADNLNNISDRQISKLIINVVSNELKLSALFQNVESNFILEANFNKEYQDKDVNRYSYLYNVY